MKHSSPVKFPVNYLITAIACCLIAFVAMAWFIIGQYQASQKVASDTQDSIVTQLNQAQYDQALESLNK